jgi:hypothetical protein
MLARLVCSFHKTTGFFKARRDKREEFVQRYEADRPAAGAATRHYFMDACHPIWGLQQWHASYEAMQAAVAKVLNHLEGYREELNAVMMERFHLVPEMQRDALLSAGFDLRNLDEDSASGKLDDRPGLAA